jgi:CMP-N-acetylneuraminic acid synthetase
MSILITICARGGSKGIPGKNIRLLNGKPLIAYTIECAQKFAGKFTDAKIGLSTDSSEIIDKAAEFGLFADYLRPAEMATDNAGKLDVIIDLKEYEERKIGVPFDYVLDLDVTSPLRTVNDLESAFDILKKDADALNLFSVSPANRNPYFNMVEEKPNGYVKKIIDKANFKSRQEAPKVYDMNASFYFYKKVFFDQKFQSPFTEKTIAYVMDHVCFDLDHPIDFTLMELLLREKLLDFEI